MTPPRVPRRTGGPPGGPPGIPRRHRCDAYRATGYLHALDLTDPVWRWSLRDGLCVFCDALCELAFIANRRYEEPTTFSALGRADAIAATGVG